MTAPVRVEQLRDRALRAFARDAAGWAASGEHDTLLELPLHPPTERAALADLEGTRAWVDSWRAVEARGGVEIDWVTRSWARVGSQQLPERARLSGAEAIARFSGTTAEWVRLVGRTDALRNVVGDGAEARAALRSHARALAGLDDADAERLVGVLEWLREHPVSDRLVRELPIRGVDSKWIETRRGLIEGLHRAATGLQTLGLRQPAPLVRFRALDPELAVGGLRDLSAPVDDLAALSWRPDRVIVVENLATMLAMPDARGTLVVHGGGYRVDLVARLPWAQRVDYWGDLDSHGFAILNRLRRHGVETTSTLMNAETLLAHRDLWGVDPQPNLDVLATLTPQEQRTLQLLSAEGNVRLEQERIPWDYARARLGV